MISFYYFLLMLPFENRYEQINLFELKKKKLEGAVIIDVRSEQEYSEGHIEGAINMPDYKINNSIENILVDKEKEIVVYCQMGSRSKKVYKKLISMNYKNVYNLYGGLDNW